MAIGRVPGETGIQPSIVTAKGDLIVATANGSVTNQAVGTNNQVLMADSAQADGVKWANEATSTLTTTGDMLYASAANTLARRAIGSTGDVLTVSGGLPTWVAPTAAAENFTLLNAGGTALTGAQTITVSGISARGTIYIFLDSASSANSNSTIGFRINGDTGTNYNYWGISNIPSTSTWATTYMGHISQLSATSFAIGRMGNTAAEQISGGVMIRGCNSSGQKMMSGAGSGTSDVSRQFVLNGFWSSSSTVTSVSAFSSTGNFDNGTMYVYASA